MYDPHLKVPSRIVLGNRKILMKTNPIIDGVDLMILALASIY